MTRLARQHQPVNVKINVLDDRALLPRYATEGSAAFDIALIEDVRLWAGESAMYRTGLVIQAPRGHMLMIAPRSSTWKKWGLQLANTIGIVDEDYCGPEDELMLYLTRPLKDHYGAGIPRIIEAGTRLAQGLFVPVTQAVFDVVDGPIAKTRGRLGSTGEREFKRHA